MQAWLTAMHALDCHPLAITIAHDEGNYAAGNREKLLKSTRYAATNLELTPKTRLEAKRCHHSLTALAGKYNIVGHRINARHGQFHFFGENRSEEHDAPSECPEVTECPLRMEEDELGRVDKGDSQTA